MDLSAFVSCISSIVYLLCNGVSGDCFGTSKVLIALSLMLSNSSDFGTAFSYLDWVVFVTSKASANLACKPGMEG